GKLVAPLGAMSSPGDKVLIGLGMMPRGEVLLIFATIGLQQGILNEDFYAALLLIVLVTTLATPPLLKMRYARLREAAAATPTGPASPTPVGGWLRLENGLVVLRGTPPAHLALPLALEAAVLVTNARPSPGLLDW